MILILCFSLCLFSFISLHFNWLLTFNVKTKMRTSGYEEGIRSRKKVSMLSILLRISWGGVGLKEAAGGERGYKWG